MQPDIFEDEIATQLQNIIDVDVADVIVLSNDDSGYIRPGAKGKIIVAYDNSDFKEALSTLPMQQSEWIEFVITLQSRTIRGDKGIYTLYKLVKDALIGFTPSDCEVPISGKFFGPPEIGTKARLDDVWTYEFHMRTKSVLVQALSVSDTLNMGVTSYPPINSALTINAQFDAPDPLPLQGLDDTTIDPPIIQLIES
jgi:hypothetical protein